MPKHKTITETADALRWTIRGEVRTDELTRQIYSTDASDYRMVPAGVVLPESAADIAAAVKTTARFNAAIIPRGGGSSLSGQTVGTGWVIDHSKYLNRILEINTAERWVWAEAGVVLDRLNAELLPHGLMVGPDPSSSAVATLGGMVGNNSTGSHSIKYRMLADHLLALEAVLSDGSLVLLHPREPDVVQRLAGQDTLEGRLYSRIPELIEDYRVDIAERFPKIWRNVAGYGLNRLLADKEAGRPFNLVPLIAGSEGTLAYVTRLKVALVARPAAVRLMVLTFDDLESALNQVPFILEQDVAAVELMTRATLQLAYDHPTAGPLLRQFVQSVPGAILIVEFAGESAALTDEQAGILEKRLAKNAYRGIITHGTTAEQIQRVWTIRKSVLGLLLSKPGDRKRTSIIDDAVVPVEQLAVFTREVTAAGKNYGIDINFDGHASAGCLHTCPDMNLKNPDDIKILEQLAKDIMRIAIAHGGSTTGEHGEGLARSHYNEQLYGPRLHQAFRTVKTLFDPDQRFNPGKVLTDRLPWDATLLRYGPDYRTPLAPQTTWFNYSRHGGLAGLVEMCNGQGVCRAQVGGVMCPSYKATLEEKHSPRGRANALRLALTGELGGAGLQDLSVHEALDLCLECKACKVECSTGVDVARLKYEFLAHYQRAHGIPLRSRMFAEMARLNRLGRLAPRLANAALAHPLVRRLLDRVIGIDQRRSLPRYTRMSFARWFERRSRAAMGANGRVVLWDDCYIRDHQPELGMAAVRILEAAGCRVIRIADRRCCGRPMISKGLLAQARANARHNVARLSEFAHQGIPIIGVEPSCIACFRDEYPDLLPCTDAQAVAAQTFFFEEFITDMAAQGRLSLAFKVPDTEKNILLHTHCYQKAFGTAAKVKSMLELLPATTVTEIDSSCCGMAGAFGYEKEHYELSMAIGEQSLFPIVRAAAAQTIIAAAGTSCREQIKDGTRRQALHPIAILAHALS